MKSVKSLIYVAVLFLSTTALASKARLTALGQDKDGSLFINDERNIFLNPAYITRFGDSANFELGATSVGTTSANSPKAEGGIMYSVDANRLGMQIGRVHRATESMLTSSSLSTGGFFAPQNSVELIFGRKGMMDFGGSLHYAKSSSNRGPTANFPDSEASVMSAAGGVATEMFTGFLHFDILHKSETQDIANSNEKYDGKTSLVGGGTFNFNAHNKIGAQASRRNFNFDNGSSVTGEYKSTRFDVIGYHQIPVEKYLIFTTGGITQIENTTDYTSTGANNRKVTTLTLPIAIGLEVQTTKWLTLRTSAKQSVLLSQVKDSNGLTDLETNNLDNTVVTAGASVVFDDLVIDATLEGADSGSGKINGNTLLANVGMKYNF